MQTSVSPQGVEHRCAGRCCSPIVRVQTSVSPQGVEHMYLPGGQPRWAECKQQCRRKALSTRAHRRVRRAAGCKHQCRRKALSTRIRDAAVPVCDVQTSVSPQGVEHTPVSTVTLALSACKHQCRRKALSTFHLSGPRRCGDVQTSVSPQGVEHGAAVGQLVTGTGVQTSVSPQGVEHYTQTFANSGAGACKHQCRR